VYIYICLGQPSVADWGGFMSDGCKPLRWRGQWMTA